MKPPNLPQDCLQLDFLLSKQQKPLWYKQDFTGVLLPATVCRTIEGILFTAEKAEYSGGSCAMKWNTINLLDTNNDD